MSEDGEAPFSPPDPEVTGSVVVCGGCDKRMEATDAHSTADLITETPQGDIKSVERRYVCSSECVLEALLSGDGK